jgi:hypothetical protein
LSTPLADPPVFPDPPPLSAPATLKRAERSSVLTDILNKLVLSHLVHHGYQGTAEVFQKNVVDRQIPDGVVDWEEGQHSMNGQSGQDIDAMEVDGEQEYKQVDSISSKLRTRQGN